MSVRIPKKSLCWLWPDGVEAHESPKMVDNFRVTETDGKHVRSKIFLDVSIGEKCKGKMVFEMCSDKYPDTVGNFRSLCTDEKGKPSLLKGSTFEFGIPTPSWLGKLDGSLAVVDSNAEGIHFVLTHGGKHVAFRLAVANQTQSKKRKTQYADCATGKEGERMAEGKHVVLAKCVHGIDLIKMITEIGAGGGTDAAPLEISDCGTWIGHGRVRPGPA